MKFKFWISFTNGSEATVEETGSFDFCLKMAENRAKFMGGVVTAWAEII